eukprot:6203328-Pleurochrysis_carterae.AAC.1
MVAAPIKHEKFRELEYHCKKAVRPRRPRPAIRVTIERPRVREHAAHSHRLLAAPGSKRPACWGLRTSYLYGGAHLHSSKAGRASIHRRLIHNRNKYVKILITKNQSCSFVARTDTTNTTVETFLRQATSRVSS